MATINLDTSRRPSTYYGKGAPDQSIGRNGDYYRDETTGDLYGPKTDGLWGPVSSTFATESQLGIGVDPEFQSATESSLTSLSTGLSNVTHRVDDLEAIVGTTGVLPHIQGGLIGNGTDHTVRFAHALNTLNIAVTIKDASTTRKVEVDWVPFDVNNVDVEFPDTHPVTGAAIAAPTVNQFRIEVLGVPGS